MPLPTATENDVQSAVRAALKEDIGSGDITAMLIPDTEIAAAKIISREAAVICGQAWVDEVFRQIDNSVTVTWHVKDGER